MPRPACWFVWGSFLPEHWAILSIVPFTDLFSARVISARQQPCFPKEAVMAPSFTEGWSICSISPLSVAFSHSGFPSGQDRNSFFSGRCSTWPMPPLPLGVFTLLIFQKRFFAFENQEVKRRRPPRQNPLKHQKLLQKHRLKKCHQENASRNSKTDQEFLIYFSHSGNEWFFV
jgi:hypothetical protein